MDYKELKVSGTQVNYYMICKRKLWLFSKGIRMEESHDRVLEGKVTHAYSYKKESSKELLIDNLIKLDIVDSDYIREVKISKKMQEAGIMQLYYYLYYLDNMGISKKGKLHYVKERRTEEIELNEEKRKDIERILEEINVCLKSSKIPQVINSNICKSCAYYSFCYVEEE